MADEKSNTYEYRAFQALPREGQQVPIGTALMPLNLRPLGTLEARDPDHALALTAEKWPPPAGQEREYSVTLASKWRSRTYKGIATVAVEPVHALAAEATPEGQAGEASGVLADAPGPLSRPGVA